MKKCLVFGLMVMGTLFSGTAKETVMIQQIASTIFLSDDFKKVTSKELTPKVIEELLKQYPTSKLGAIYLNSKREFKLIMILKSGTRRTVYIDEHGNWLKKK